MIKQNTTGDFASPKWIEDFLSENSLTSIIDSTDIEDYEFHRIEKTYTVNNDRVGAIVQIRKGGRTKRAIIDFKRGDATWDQLMDMTFNFGNDCDYQIAVYDYSQNVEDDRDDHIHAECLVDCLVAYGCKVYMVRGERTPGHQGSVRYEYSCVSSGDEYSSETFSEKLPSKRQFEHAEFMTLHYGLDCGYNTYAMFRPAEWNFGNSRSFVKNGYDMKDLDLLTTWSDSGLYMIAIPKSDEGFLAIQWISKNKRKELRKEFKNCKIRLYKKNGLPARLSVRILDKPFREVAHLGNQKKDRYGELVHYEENNWLDILENLLDDMPEKF
jgi:hypothetical protein